MRRSLFILALALLPLTASCGSDGRTQYPSIITLHSDIDGNTMTDDPVEECEGDFAVGALIPAPGEGDVVTGNQFHFDNDVESGRGLVRLMGFDLTGRAFLLKIEGAAGYVDSASMPPVIVNGSLGTYKLNLRCGLATRTDANGEPDFSTYVEITEDAGSAGNTNFVLAASTVPATEMLYEMSAADSPAGQSTLTGLQIVAGAPSGTVASLTIEADGVLSYYVSDLLPLP